jgi:hypothetical protein
MILSLQQGLAEDGFKVSLVKLCQWFEMPRRTVYYRSTKAAPKVQESALQNRYNPDEYRSSRAIGDGQNSRFGVQ